MDLVHYLVATESYYFISYLLQSRPYAHKSNLYIGPLTSPSSGSTCAQPRLMNETEVEPFNTSLGIWDTSGEVWNSHAPFIARIFRRVKIMRTLRFSHACPNLFSINEMSISIVFPTVHFLHGT